MGVKFLVAELRNELKYCDTIANKYLEPQSQGKLKRAADQLSLISSKLPKTNFNWQIEKADSLQTKQSSESMVTSGCGHSLQGRLCFKWTLRSVDRRTVELVGIASTAISIHEVVNSTVSDEPVFEWHTDVVTVENAPGPAFHSQVYNPAKLDVPRLPSILFSPADCLDFLLGELYQDEWDRHQSSHINIQRFAKTQQSRFCHLLDKQSKMLGEDFGLQSAWIALKNWKPSDKVFLSE